MGAAGPVNDTFLALYAPASSGPVNEEALFVFERQSAGPVTEELLEIQVGVSLAEAAGPIYVARPKAALALDEAASPIYVGTARTQGVPLGPSPVYLGRPLSGVALTQGAGPVFRVEVQAITPHVIEDLAAEQRDLVGFLVDVTWAVYQAQEIDATWTLEFKQGASGTWAAATAQPYDWRHTVTQPITGVPAASPGKSVGFVWHAFFDLPEGEFEDIYLQLTVASSPPTVATVGPISVSTVTTEAATALEAQLAKRSILARTPLDFLGNGLVIPFTRGSRDFTSASEVELVKSSVRQILGTRAAVGRMPGELKWRPDFGSKLWVLRHRQNSSTLEAQANAFVLEAMRWEPRVEVTSVTTEKPDPYTLKVLVRYQIITEDRDDNRVLLPEFEEVVTIT